MRVIWPGADSFPFSSAAKVMYELFIEFIRLCLPFFPIANVIIFSFLLLACSASFVSVWLSVSFFAYVTILYASAFSLSCF